MGDSSPMAPKKSPPAPTSVRDRLRMGRDFDSIREEGVLALMLAHEAVRLRFVDALADEGPITLQQYNVLRILRGAGDAGLPTLEIADRMIERAPGITRLLDRIEKLGLVARERSAEDRRQVWCKITPEGLRQLEHLDQTVTALDEDALSALSDKEVKTLLKLLNRVRCSQEPSVD